MNHALYLKVAGWNLCQAASCGKLVSKVMEMLRKLGLVGGWSACLVLFWVISQVYRPWRAVLAR